MMLGGTLKSFTLDYSSLVIVTENPVVYISQAVIQLKTDALNTWIISCEIKFLVLYFRQFLEVVDPRIDAIKD